MKKIALITVSTLLLGLSLNSLGASNIAAGKAKSAMCVGCHGVAGKSMIPAYPNLAGQNSLYLENALNAYKNKHRTGTQASIMQGMAAGLNDNEIKNLAAYFSSLK